MTDRNSADTADGIAGWLFELPFAHRGARGQSQAKSLAIRGALHFTWHAAATVCAHSDNFAHV